MFTFLMPLGDMVTKSHQNQYVKFIAKENA